MRHCYFCDKCVIFARNCKFAKLTKDIYHVFIYSALLASERNSVFDPKSTFFPKVFQRVCKTRQILISRQNSGCYGLNFRLSPNFLAKALCALAQLPPPCSKNLPPINTINEIIIRISFNFQTYVKISSSSQHQKSNNFLKDLPPFHLPTLQNFKMSFLFLFNII